MGECQKITEADRICVPVPFYHCFGCVLGVLCTGICGAAMIVPAEHFDAPATLYAIGAERATSLYGVPTMFIAQLEHADFAKRDLSSLRTGVMAGSPCPIEVLNRVVDDMGGDEIDAICGVAASCGSWILSDEIYRGTELDGQETMSLWGSYEKVIVTGGLSKAYGLPGLRLGWLLAPVDLAEALWARHDYTSIAPGAMSDLLANQALEPDYRAKLLERGRGILRRNLPLVEERLKAAGASIGWIRPQAGAMLCLACAPGTDTTALAERLLREASTLVVPGEYFGLPGHLRIGYGALSEEVLEGIDRLLKML